MTALMRLTKTVIALAWVVSLFASLCHAETVTTYSGQYTADLERKQMLLESVREDVCKIDNKSKEDADKANIFKKDKTSYLGIENIELAKIVPPTKRADIAFTCMNSMLSPRDGISRLSGREKDPTGSK